ncbi:unnamed protein product [Sphagnum balticum]
MEPEVLRFVSEEVNAEEWAAAGREECEPCRPPGEAGKVYKVKLNDGKEGKEARFFVAKKMFLEGLSEEEIRSAFAEVLPRPPR